MFDRCTNASFGQGNSKNEIFPMKKSPRPPSNTIDSTEPPQHQTLNPKSNNYHKLGGSKSNVNGASSPAQLDVDMKSLREASSVGCEELTWKELALLFDRFFLIIFLFTMSFMSIAVIAYLYVRYYS